MASQATQDVIRPVMVGTAGHVDHGKSSLVRNLTDRDPDTLVEEQRRGMSIEFAVVPCRLTDGSMVGLIDVPGHEDFIRNMAAGAASVDVVMLVIAADDLVMPQTEEHLRIAQILGMTRLFVVLTKTDLFDEDYVELAREEITTWLVNKGITDTPICNVSNLRKEGIEEVRATLTKAVESVQREPDRRAFRMDVRKAFSAKGRGTVITGVPSAGQLAVGETLVLLPSGITSVVRGVQTYRSDSSDAMAHRSCALNVPDLTVEDFSHNATLVEPGTYRPTSSLLVWFENNSDSITLKRSTPVRLHAGMKGNPVDIRLLGVAEIGPGEAGPLRIILPQPEVLVPGDRFVLRRLSPSDTLGGGIILSLDVERLRRSAAELPDRVTAARGALAEGDYLLAELLLNVNPVVATERLRVTTQHSGSEAAPFLQALGAKAEVLALGADGYILRRRLPECTTLLARQLRFFHRNQPYAWGMTDEAVARVFGTTPAAAAVLVAALAKLPEFVVRQGRIGMAGFQPPLNDRQSQLRQRFLNIIEDAGIQSMALGNIKDALQPNEADLKVVVKLAVEDGSVVQLGNSFLSKATVQSALNSFLTLFETMPSVDIGSFRTATGLSRNIAATVLEYYDAQGYCRRVGNGRVLSERGKLLLKAR